MPEELIDTLHSENESLQHFPQFVVVPQTDENTFYKGYVSSNMSQVGREVEANLKLINELDAKRLAINDRTNFRKIKSFLNKIWKSYRDRLRNFGDSHDAINETPTYLENNNLALIPEGLSPYPAKVERLGLFFEESLSKAIGETVVISESHATTVPLLRVLKESSPDSRIGVIVFDTHIDTDPGPEGDVPRKSNTLRLLVTKDSNGNKASVEQLVVVGVPDEIYAEQLKSKSKSPDTYGEKIKVIPRSEILVSDDDLFIQRNKFRGRLLEIIQQFQKSGITNVLVSVDIDVLPSDQMGLTAMEYNPLHALLYLSSLELGEYKDNPRMINDLLTNSGFAGEIQGSILDSPIGLGGIGVSIRLMRHGLATIQEYCKQNGLEYGIKYKDSKVIGDIVELSGPDYQNLTKKAVLDIGQAMVGGK